MTTQNFNDAAEKKQPYAFDYNREVAAFYRDHPEQKKTIFFIDASTLPSSLLRGDETDEDEISDMLCANGHLAAAIRKTYEDGVSGSVPFNEEGYDCVILKLPRNQSNVNPLGCAAPSADVDAFTFDHELGHLLCPDGRSTFNLQECVADAYAVIRHIQRFGAASDAIEGLPAMRAVEMILGSEGTHFTSPVIEQILEDAKKLDFSKLTPQETVALAESYAHAHAMEPMFVKYISSNFAASRFRLVEFMSGNFNQFMTLGQTVLSTPVPKEFKWGAVAIRAILDGQVAVDGVRLAPPAGKEWERLRHALDARSANTASEKELILLGNAPQMKQP